MRSPRLVLSALIVLTSSGPVSAQWSGVPGVNNAITTDTSNLPAEPVMVSDGAGGAMFVWRMHLPTDSDLRAQRLDATGARQWGDTGAAIAVVPGYVQDFDMTSDAAGGAFFIWRDERLVSGVASKDVYVQRLNAAGQPQWGTDGQVLRTLATLGIGGAETDFLLADGAGGCYFFTRADDFNARRLHRLAGNGSVVTGWPAGGAEISTYGYPHRMITDTAASTPGEHGVWLIMNSAGGGITTRRVSAAGVVGPEIPIPNNFGTYSYQGACTDGAGGFFLVTGTNADLFILRVLANGTFAWPETDKRVVLAGGGANNSGSQPVDLSPDGAGGVIVTSLGPAPGTSNLRMMAQRLTPLGERMWGDNGIDVHAPGTNIYSGRSISDGNGGVIVTWGTSTPSEFRAQRLDGSGTKLWPAPGVLISAPWGLNQLVTDQASGAIFSVIISSNGGTIYDFGAKRTTLTGSLGSNSPLARLVNISSRAPVGSGDDVLIPGFVVAGGSLQLLVRAIGPTLVDYDVVGSLADAELTLYNAANQPISTNDDWGLAANAAEIQTVAAQVNAFALPAGSKDSALLATLQPGLYTAVMRGVNGATGVGLVEMYEVGGAANTGRVANMSVRARVGTGDSILIPGIVVGGTDARTLLIRAIGPTLAGYGVAGALADPRLALFTNSGTQLAVNDDWSTPNGSQISSFGAQVQAFALPAGSKDAAFLITLSPGTYTAQVSGVNDTTGVCLVEVYEIP